MNYYFILASIAFCVSAFVWIYVFAQQKRDPINLTFLLFAANNLGWIGSELLLYFDVARGHEIAILRTCSLFWVPCGFWFLVFAYALVGKRKDLVILLAGIAAIGGVAVSLFPDAVVTGMKYSRWGVVPFFHQINQPLISIITAVTSAYAVLLILKKRSKSTDRRERLSLGLLVFGAVIVMSFIAMMNVFVPNIFDFHETPMLGSSAFVVFVVLVFLAVTRYRFMSISVEKVAEELFEDIHEGILLADPTGRVLRSNLSAREIFGESIEGKDVRDLFFGHDAFGEFADLVIPYRKGNSEERYCSLSSSTIRRGGEILGKIFTARDVTEQKRAEAVLRKSKEDLEKEVEERTAQLRHAQRMEAVGTLAGGIAHDFNNVLAVILGFANAAKQDTPKTNPVYSDLDEIIVAGNRGRDIVRQMLTISRKQDITDHSPSDLNAIVRETVDLLKVSLPPNISLRLDIPAKPVGVLCDTTQIAQVIMNLCNNAIYAMKGKVDGVLSVCIKPVIVDEHFFKTGIELKHGPYVELSIGDTGCGIEESVLPQIFNPFFTTKPPGEGTGLGLATTLIIVQNHEGGSTVRSKIGEGTVFCIYLPTILQSSAEFKAMGRRDSDPPEPFEKQLESILLVDDEPQVRRMGRRVLEQLGYDVVDVQGGEDALTEIGDNFSKFDLIITDYNMPKISGLSLAKELKSRGSFAPVILMSGYGDKVTRDEMEAAGIVVFIQKPAGKKQLGVTIRRILDGRTSGF
jgi:PAS domain S-box-containing protein